MCRADSNNLEGHKLWYKYPPSKPSRLEDENSELNKGWGNIIENVHNKREIK